MPTLQQGTWTYWNTTATVTMSSTTATWINWTSNTTANSTLVIDPATNQPSAFLINHHGPEVIETAEDRERRARWEAEVEQRRAAREEEARRIRERAEETLALLLTPEQLEDWRRTSSFRLITQSGREYRITRGVAGNVKLIEQGEEVESLCAHPNGVPREDVVIAQLLALRTDEEAFRRTANISPIRRGLHAA